MSWQNSNHTKKHIGNYVEFFLKLVIDLV